MKRFIFKAFITFSISCCGSASEKIIQSLTLRQKIGQLFIVAAASSFEQPGEVLSSQMIKSPYRMDKSYIESLIHKYHIGGICWLFRSTPEKQMALTKHYQNISELPLLIAQDCEWGLSMRLDNTIKFPKAGDLGKLRNKQLIYEMGKEIGMQCREIGVHMNLAPVVDVNSNPDNPVIGIRSFGDDPKQVAQCAALFAKGLQDGGVLSCAKHFPGHGDTSIDSHLDLPVIRHDRKRLEEVELYPFKKLIEAGVDAVMTAHLLVLAYDLEKPATLSKNIITNLLRNQLNFSGLIITDGLGMRALTNYYKPGEIELNALLAGNDILLCPVDVPKAVELIEKAIKEGRIKEEEIDRRVFKILSIKEKLGLLARKHS